MAYRQQPTPGEIVIMAAGPIMLVFSFFDFASHTTSWGSGIFPIATLLPLYGVIMAVQIAATRFTGMNLPKRAFGFSWEQVHLALGIMAALLALGFLSTDIADKQIGLWIEVLGGVALGVGAWMLQHERHTGVIG